MAVLGDSGPTAGRRGEPRDPLHPTTKRDLTMEAYDRLVHLVNEIGEEVRKAEGGNKAAGTRVRKAMQEVKKAAQDVRVGILEARTDEG